MYKMSKRKTHQPELEELILSQYPNWDEVVPLTEEELQRSREREAIEAERIRSLIRTLPHAGIKVDRIVLIPLNNKPITKRFKPKLKQFTIRGSSEWFHWQPSI
jgi:hypothetical protein